MTVLKKEGWHRISIEVSNGEEIITSKIENFGNYELPHPISFSISLWNVLCKTEVPMFVVIAEILECMTDEKEASDPYITNMVESAIIFLEHRKKQQQKKKENT